MIEPLGGVLSDLEETLSPDENSKTYLRVMKEEFQNVFRAVENVISVMGMEQIQPVKVEINEFMRRVEALSQDVIGGMQARFEFLDMPHEVLVSKGLKDIIQHMLGHAREAEATVVEVQLKHQTNSVGIMIRDNGKKGIASQDIDNIFLPFFSPKKIHVRSMTLYRVRKILRLLGGNIAVKSQPGAGTEFA